MHIYYVCFLKHTSIDAVSEALKPSTHALGPDELIPLVSVTIKSTS